MSDPLDILDQKFEDSDETVAIPKARNFREFLVKHAVAKGEHGFAPFSFVGREGLSVAVDFIDYVLGNPIDTDVELPHIPGVSVKELQNKRAPLKDAKIAICGGAQIGKTILELWLKVYLMALKWLAVGLYLPDDDLVQGVVDGKFRPEVIDQAPWFARMISIGKTLNESGRAVHRKGAFIVTDGNNNALGMMRGMAKFPTTFTMDAQIIDERDDIPEKKANYLPGRMTAGSLRLTFTIGTQRKHGAGQNKEFKNGTQHIGWLTCPDCGHKSNPDKDWPGICRVAMDSAPHNSDPRLTIVGDFKHEETGPTVFTFDPMAHYYFACTDCGAALDRNAVKFTAERPERFKIRHFSVRVAQTTSSAIDLVQLVSGWCLSAVMDPESMIAFACDRTGIPKNALQALDPVILDRARGIEPFSLSLQPRAQTASYGGLDTGDRCWFSVKEVESSLVNRITWLEQMSAESVRSRVPQLFDTMGLSGLFVDAGPLRDLARDLCFLLNDLVDFEFPRMNDPEKAYINFGNGLVWDGPNGKWNGLKCAAVEFSLKDGKGIRQQLGITQDGKMYPLIQCNRDETIQYAVNEFLTAEEGIIDMVMTNGTRRLRTEPITRLPQRGTGAPKILETFDAHLLTGSQKEEGKDGMHHYVDDCENHLLLSVTYADLCKRICGSSAAVAAMPFRPASNPGRAAAAYADRRDRSCIG